MAKQLDSAHFSGISTIVSWARFFIAELDQQGVDTTQLLQQAGLAANVMDDPNQRIDIKQMTQLWQLAIQRTGNPCLALDLAEKVHANIFGGLGLMIMFSETIGDAIEKALRYGDVASNAATLHMKDEENNRLALIYELHTDIANEAMEAFIACSDRLLKQLSHGRFRVLEIQFPHDKSDFQQRYETFFDAPIIFNAPAFKCLLDKNTLDLPCSSANPDMAANMEVWITRYLNDINTPPLTQKVRQYLLNHFMMGKTDQTQVARSLALSTRGLQRGLQEEGQSFRQLVEETRHTMAKNLLRQNQLSLTEISYLLGFSDQSNFTKACKRWFNQTPSQYRRQLLLQ